jgi:hypothetical protein
MSFYYLLFFLFNKIGEQEGGTGSAWKQGEGGRLGVEVAQTMCTYMNKCKTDRINK